MSRILVLYRSKYGSTKKYADMLKEELACDVFEIGNFPFHQAEHYDFIIAAGGIYAGGISVMKDIRRNQRFLSDKNVVIFAVGASPFYPKTFEELKKQNLKDLSFSVTMFYGRGAYDESVMNFKDRTLCRMLKKSLQKSKPETLEPWMEAFLEADGKSCDWTDRAYLEPLFDYLNVRSAT